ncbi:MAG: glycosyltransferase [Candidatus Omnitrophica bacterium]|nr:glycosyltransferase [Candidatus Omnitrophota bacterium]
MHVLQLIPTLDVGGVERGVLDLTGALVAQGHQVTVVSAGGSLVDGLRRMGAQHVTLPVQQKSPTAIWRAIPALTELIRSTQVDLVHARSRVPAWSGYFAARRAGVPFVTTCHGFYNAHPASRVMTWGRVVIVPSTALARYLVQAFHLPVERVRVIPRGVDLERFVFRGADAAVTAPSGGERRIGIIGRLTALKGHAVAIRALHQLRQQRLPVRLCIVGDAPGPSRLRERLEALARSLGVERAIEWQGIRHDVPQVLASLDVIVAPSVYPESFGRSLIEAQAVGVPVAASDLGAFPELVQDGDTGLLVPPGDPTRLAGAVARLLGDAPLRRRVVEQARHRVETAYALPRMVEETLRVYQDCVTTPRILVWKLSALGDAVLAGPSLRAIRRRFPHSTIHLAAGRAVYEVFARCPYVNEVVVYDPARKDRAWAAKFRWIRRLKRTAYDLSIDLQNSRWTHAASWLAGIRMRLGYARRWARALNQPVRLPAEPLGPVAHQHYLLKAGGIVPDGEALELWPSDADDAAADGLLREAQIPPGAPIVGIHLGGSGRWVTKRWDLDRWAALCDTLAAEGIQVVVTGHASERPMGDALLRLTHARPHVLIGRTRLMELACLIKRCRVFITGDSAPLHLAAAVGTPTLALFGPTDPQRHVPPSAHLRVLYKRVFCSPCYSPRCRTITHACMKRITVEEVFTATKQLLQHTASRQPTAHSRQQTEETPS